MRRVVGDRAVTGSAASASQIGRFETKWLSRPENLAALADLPGQWIDKVHQRRPPKTIVFDMDSEREPDPWRTGGQRLQWPLRLHVLSPGVRVQPAWRCGTVCFTAGQRPQRLIG
jgi:hypothetical protein